MFEPLAMPERGVLLALDISKHALGFAACDPDRLLSTPLHTIKRGRWSETLDAILALQIERRAVGLVLGYPLNMDGSAGPAAQSRRDIAALIAKAAPQIPILMQDERLTTDAITDAFDEGRWRRPKGGGPLDHYAAAIILDDAMSAIARAHAPNSTHNKGNET